MKKRYSTPEKCSTSSLYSPTPAQAAVVLTKAVKKWATIPAQKAPAAFMPTIPQGLIKQKKQESNLLLFLLPWDRCRKNAPFGLFLRFKNTNVNIL